MMKKWLGTTFSALCILPVLCLAALLLSFTPVCFGEEAGTSDQDAKKTYLLRYTWTKGTVLNWEVTHSNRTVTKVGTQTENVDTYTHSMKTWAVESVDENGTGTIVNQVPWVDMRERREDGSTRTFDSRKEMVPEEGFDTVPESLGRDLSRVEISARGEQLSRKDYRASTIVQQANQAYVCILFPEEAIPVGHSWTHQYPVYVQNKVGDLKRVEMIQRFTLQSVSNGIARIDYSTKILSPIQDMSIRAQLLDRLYEGIFLFDVDRGRAIMLTERVDQSVMGFRGEISSLKVSIDFIERLILQ
ncbi:MAG: hypothetical protein E7029_03690 [Planctomycetaceae bacterium]|nr:hypothetical protein [Planctomycetaceae bacterium]